MKHIAVSWIVLIFICTICLIIALAPFIYPFTLSESQRSGIELAGVFLIWLQIIIPTPMTAVAFFTYKLSEKLFNLKSLSITTTVLLPILIIMPAAFVYPLYGGVYLRVKDAIDKNFFAVRVLLISEKVIQVESIVEEPYLYEYFYEMEINNSTRKSFEKIPIRVSLGLEDKSEYTGFQKIPPYAGGRDFMVITIHPGKNIISGSLPIIFMDNAKINPTNTEVKLQIIMTISNISRKVYSLKSNLPNWKEIYTKQQDFYKKNKLRR